MEGSFWEVGEICQTSVITFSRNTPGKTHLPWTLSDCYLYFYTASMLLQYRYSSQSSKNASCKCRMEVFCKISKKKNKQILILHYVQHYCFKKRLNLKHMKLLNRASQSNFWSVLIWKLTGSDKFLTCLSLAFHNHMFRRAFSAVGTFMKYLIPLFYNLQDLRIEKEINFLLNNYPIIWYIKE